MCLESIPSRAHGLRMGNVLPKAPQGHRKGEDAQHLSDRCYCGMCEADGSGVGLLCMCLAGFVGLPYF